MMERLFAVNEQREIFLLLTACGFIWGALTDGADALRRKRPILGLTADAAGVLILLAMLLAVLMRTHEGVRLYGLLGVAVGALLYRSGLSRVLHAACAWVKKACMPEHTGRKNGLRARNTKRRRSEGGIHHA